MVPAVFIQMDELPLTGNGKIDRRALPIPDANVSRGVSYVAPRNGTEQKVADIWAQVLQAEQVGAYDHFFDIGGHSLAGMKMLALVHQELGVELSLKDLFQSPTVEGLAQVIASAEKGTAASISPKQRNKIRILFLHRKNGCTCFSSLRMRKRAITCLGGSAPDR
nr:phosphopantetheine-binding protein [Bacillus subtilis]